MKAFIKLVVILALASPLWAQVSKGTFSGAIASPGFELMALDSTKSYLVNGNTGHPVFIQGEQIYNLGTELSSVSDITLCLSTLQSQGYNFVWVALTDVAFHDNAPNDNWPTYGSGAAPFGASPFTSMNESYFAHLDFVIQQAAVYGIEILLNVDFVGSLPEACNDTSGWCSELKAASSANLTAWGAYLGARYRRFPNIIWLFGGDLSPYSDSAAATAEQYVLNGIQANDPNHLFTCENLPTDGTHTSYNSQDGWTAGTWGLDAFYHDTSGSSGEGTMNSDANAAYTRSDHLPTFLIEDALEGENGSPTNLGQRTEKYQAVLGGTTLGAVFGNCVQWGMGYDYGNCSSWSSSTQWKTNFSTSGSQGMQYLGQLFRSREFWKMAPDTTHSVLTGGVGSGATGSVCGCTSDGQTCIVYDPIGNSQAPQIAMSHFSGTVHAWWFNPSSAATTDLSTFTNSGTQTFTPTDGNDWVLVLDLASAGLAAPGTTTE